MDADGETSIADLPRWTWVILGVLLGLLHGSIREWSSPKDPTDDYDVLLTDQRQFETALLSERLGHRQFEDVTVYPHRVRDPASGTIRLVHVVTGSYWNGATTQQDGALHARWDPACFVAPVPYEPLLVPAADGAVASAQALRYDSVLDYLALLRERRGVRFRFAWWWWAVRPTATSAVAGAVLVGGVWPTVLNLVAFGRLTRPRRARIPWLRRARAPRHESPVPGAPNLLHEFPPHPESVSPTPVDATAPPALTASSSTLATADSMLPSAGGAHEDRHYGARPDDFYPTELRVEPPHDS